MTVAPEMGRTSAKKRALPFDGAGCYQLARVIFLGSKKRLVVNFAVGVRGISGKESEAGKFCFVFDNIINRNAGLEPQA